MSDLKTEAARLANDIHRAFSGGHALQGVSIAEAALSAARTEAIEEAARVPGRVVLTEIRGLDGLTLTGPERDEWIVRMTARKVLAQVAAEIRALVKP